MPKIPYQISPIPSLALQIVHVLYNTVAPAVEIARVVDATDHSSPQSVLFPNLDPGTYIVKIHSSVDGVTLGNLLHDFWVDALTDDSQLEYRFYTVNGPGDVDPTVGNGNKIIDPYISGKNVISVFRENSRPLQKNVEWELVDDTIQLLVDRVNGTPIEHYDQATWVLLIMYSQPAGPVANQVYDDVVIVTGDFTVDSGQHNKTIFARAVGNKLTAQMVPLATFPENKGFELVHDRGNAINVILQMFAGETCRFKGNTVQRVVLGIGDHIRVIKKTIAGVPTLFVKIINGPHWDCLGKEEPGRVVRDNTIIADGTEYDLSVYVRLDDIRQALPGDQIVTYAEWDDSEGWGTFDTVYPNRGFYAYDPINNMLKVPDLRNSYVKYLKNIGGSDPDRFDNISGGLQGWVVGMHNHAGIQAENTSHGGASSVQSGPDVKLLVNTSGGTVATISQAITGVVNLNKQNNTQNIGYIPLILI